MKAKLTLIGIVFIINIFSQEKFNQNIEFKYITEKIILPKSPLKTQILFIGGVDSVQTTATYGNAKGKAVAKQWHDFIGFTPDNTNGSQDLGWITINHERIEANDRIGDGGGMTVFKIKREPNTDTLIIVNQTLPDGRSGKFFNVDFVNFVGETGMNCGGINSAADGRVWTAEEWFRKDNRSIYGKSETSAQVRDTNNFTISNSGISMADGKTIPKYQNFNWMVEIDPKKAKAIRKQYNWGRQPFEGGMILPDNKTVFLGADDTPGYLTKFVANTTGDFTSGTTYVYKQDSTVKWVEIDNSNFNKMLNFKAEATQVGATMFNRLEWIAYNPKDGNIYITETGRDNPAEKWNDEYESGGKFAQHHINRANEQNTTPNNTKYHDYYGRILKFDVTSDEVSVYLEGGPNFSEGVISSKYPSIHLSNPDGLNFLTLENSNWMLICEDLNGTSMGRMPEGYSNRSCELFLLDMSIETPTVNDLIRIAVTPLGAEITGVKATPDGKTILFNSQHPSNVLPYPYNNSLTVAITGWDKVLTGLSVEDKTTSKNNDFSAYPNPVSQTLYLNKFMDIALYDSKGSLIKIMRNIKQIDLSKYDSGTYFIKNNFKQTKKIIIQ